MENLLSEGFTLLVFGMGFVFVFLTLLVVITNFMSKIVSKYQPAPQPKVNAKKRASPAAAQGNQDELVAVITAAVHKYRS